MRSFKEFFVFYIDFEQMRTIFLMLLLVSLTAISYYISWFIADMAIVNIQLERNFKKLRLCCYFLQDVPFNPFVANVPVTTPLKTSGSRERVHWEQVGYFTIIKFKSSLIITVASVMGSSINYVRQVFQETNLSYPRIRNALHCILKWAHLENIYDFYANEKFTMIFYKSSYVKTKKLVLYFSIFRARNLKGIKRYRTITSEE